MIGLLTQNNLYAMTFVDILKDCGVEMRQQSQSYEAYLLIYPWPNHLPKGKYITLGGHVEGEVCHIDTPVHPEVLIQKIRQVTARQMNSVSFENTCFIFQKEKRLLIDKATDTTIPLTEKECELLAELAKVSPDALTKEELLDRVWRYKPDLETHTLESHIYGLRQKIGNHVDSLFQSTDSGYRLITD